MSKQQTIDRSEAELEQPRRRRRHPITRSNSAEETKRRMACFPERAAKFRETLRVLGEQTAIKQEAVASSEEEAKDLRFRRCHPITMENSPEETMRRMASFPERAARFKETLRVLRETNSG